MPEEFLHINKNEFKKDFYILLLIVPALVFALALAVLFTKTHKYASTALTTNGNSAVLGETNDNP